MGLGPCQWHGTQGLPPPFRRPLCPSCRVGFAPIPTKSGESRASWILRVGRSRATVDRASTSRSACRSAGAREGDQGQRRPRHRYPPWSRWTITTEGPSITRPRPAAHTAGSHSLHKMRERQRQTATKPRYYIRGIEITAQTGLGRFGGAGVASPSTSSHHHHVVHLGLGRASWHGTQGLPPPFRRPLCPSWRAGFAPIPTKSGASRASGWICGSWERRRPGPARSGRTPTSRSV